MHEGQRDGRVYARLRVAASSSIYGNNNPNGHVRILPGRRRSLKGPTVRPRERKPSETVPVDLLRVVEESEELAPAASTGDRTGRMERINLGNGKWPNDFLDALNVPSSSSPSRPIAIRKPSLWSGDFAPADPLGLSASFSVNSSAYSPPRDSVDSLSPSLSFPSPGISHPLSAAAARRPTQLPIPFPRAVSGESPSPLNTPSQSQQSQSQSPQVDPLERAGSTSPANSPL
ncbi:hypothetical protein V8E53_004049 [Lactarius tabidus]